MLRRVLSVLGIVFLGISMVGGFTHGKESSQLITPYLLIPAILFAIGTALVFGTVQKKKGPLIFWGLVGAAAGALAGATVFSLTNLNLGGFCCLIVGVMLCLPQGLEKWQARNRRRSGPEPVLGLVGGIKRFGVMQGDGTMAIYSQIYSERPPGRARRRLAL